MFKRVKGQFAPFIEEVKTSIWMEKLKNLKDLNLEGNKKLYDFKPLTEMLRNFTKLEKNF